MHLELLKIDCYCAICAIWIKKQLSLTSMLSKSAMSKGVKTQAKNTDLGYAEFQKLQPLLIFNYWIELLTTFIYAMYKSGVWYQ